MSASDTQALVSTDIKRETGNIDRNVCNGIQLERVNALLALVGRD